MNLSYIVSLYIFIYLYSRFLYIYRKYVGLAMWINPSRTTVLVNLQTLIVKLFFLLLFFNSGFLHLILNNCQAFVEVSGKVFGDWIKIKIKIGFFTYKLLSYKQTFNLSYLLGWILFKLKIGKSNLRSRFVFSKIKLQCNKEQ